MTITANDLKLFAAAYPDDTATGGGRMSANVVQTGTRNNVFPDVDAVARVSGRVQLRKVFVAVTSADATSLMSGQLAFAAGSSDANVDVVAFKLGDADTLRPSAVDRLLRSPFGFYAADADASVGASNFVRDLTSPNVITVTSGTAPPVGTLVAFAANQSYVNPALVTWVTASSGQTATLADPIPASVAVVLVGSRPNPTQTQIVGAAVLTELSSGASVRVNRVMARVVPALSPYPTSVNGLSADPGSLAAYKGRLPIFRVGDSVVIRNGTTSEVATVSAVDYTGGLSFAAPLANSYPAGSIVSALLELGDLGASVGPSFAQQTWTRAWSDSILGNPIGVSYNTITGSITATNSGAETERWAIVFTSATAFNLIGEHVGQIASGTTAADFSPLNPITGAPYFTIAAAGWGTGWAIGNVLRFNTTGARAPIWLVRCVSPSAAGAVNTPALEMRGSVNA